MAKETKPNLRAPTTTTSARLTDSGMDALDEEADRLGVARSDGQRVLLVQALRGLGHDVEDARVDRAIERSGE